MFGILVKNKFQIIQNSFLHDFQQKKWRKFLGIAGSGYLFWFMLQWIQDVFQIMLQTNILSGTVTDRIELFTGSMTLIFNGLFIFLFVGAISISVHYLYTSADLNLLLATPISLRAVFSFKIIETIFVNTGIFFLIGGAILAGQGLLINASWLFYLNMLIVGILFICLPTMLAIFLTLGIVRLLPPQRVRELSSAVTALIGLGIWLLIQAFRMSLSEAPVPGEPTFQLLNYSHLSRQFWTPGMLVSDFCRYYLNPTISFPWVSLAELIAGTTGLFWLTLNFSVRQYLNSGTITQETLLIKNVRRKQIQSKKKGVPAFSRALIWKDLRLIYRNPQLSIQFVVMMAMMLFISLMIPVSGKQPGLTTNFSENSFSYFFMLFIIVSAQNASRLIPLEGKAFWLIQIVPAGMGQFLKYKFLLGFLMNQVMATLMIAILVFWHQLSLFLFVHLFTLSLLINLSATAIGIWTGSRYPRFDWEHPKRMLAGSGGLILTGLSILLFTLVMISEYVLKAFISDFSRLSILNFILLFILGLILLFVVLKNAPERLAQTEF